ncbi:hypothetical protein ACLB2K_073243 [Fragaria x ananassa]
MWDISIHPPWESDALVGTLAPHGRVALIPFVTSQDPLRRNTILSALGPSALTVLFPAAQEQLPSRLCARSECNSSRLFIVRRADSSSCAVLLQRTPQFAPADLAHQLARVSILQREADSSARGCPLINS